ncbi:MAG: hypothetical protein D6B26_02790 [Spirochaetaceae bacterium]|nr:MAG: hypothetical protein D6B26_02790 [Spirochaetaceae bacterium]
MQMNNSLVKDIGLRLLGLVQAGDINVEACVWERVSVVLNPVAGSMARKKNVNHWLEILENSGLRAGLEDTRHNVYLTEYAGHGIELGRQIGLGKITSGKHLVITCGGDGTHEEVLSGLIKADQNAESIRILRIPMGSGNDAADVASLQELVNSSSEQQEESHKFISHPVKTVEVTLSGGEKLYAFNIASFGLDAMVVVWSNRLKNSRVFPGDSYKLVANIVSLFYRPDFSAGPLRLNMNDIGQKCEGDVVLLAIGVDGHLSYGQGKNVLPGPENICALFDMSIINRIKLKKLFYRGEHVFHPKASMYSSRSLDLFFSAPLYFQADGEQRLLKPDDFPIKIEIKSTVIENLTSGKAL